MKVTQHIAPKAVAKRASSTTPGNLIMHLVMDWSHYANVGMTPASRDRIIDGLRDGTVDPQVLCETLGITTQAMSQVERDQQLLAEAHAELERNFGRVIGAA